MGCTLTNENPIEEAGSYKRQIRLGFGGGIGRNPHTRAEVHRNWVAGQVETQDRAYQEGSPVVGSLVGVLASQGGPDRNRQGDLTAN